jgi:sulfur carrier protein ThiS
MLTIKLNGLEQKLNIGCRTFVSLEELLNLLKTEARGVSLNGTSIHHTTFSEIFIKGGDAIELA